MATGWCAPFLSQPVAASYKRTTLLTVTIKDTPPTCVLKETTCSTSAEFPLPISKAGLVAALKTLLSDPERQTTEAGSVHIDRMRDGPRVCHGSGSFAIRYADAIPLVLEA
jgi:hypothetical protein